MPDSLCSCGPPSGHRSGRRLTPGEMDATGDAFRVEAASCAEFHVDRLSDTFSRDLIRRACREASGWEVRVMDNGAHVGNLVTKEDAAILAEAKARLAGKGSETEATPQD